MFSRQPYFRGHVFFFFLISRNPLHFIYDFIGFDYCLVKVGVFFFRFWRTRNTRSRILVDIQKCRNRSRFMYSVIGAHD